MHEDLKETAFLLAALSWAGLAVLLVGVGPLRFRGIFDRAAVFFVAATMTRLAFTHVRTRWQITAFVLVASVAVLARIARTGPGGGALRWASLRWAASVAGIVVGAVSTREFVHHVVERWM